jgi:transcriptional repressor of cell division inhibition gene dicB
MTKQEAIDLYGGSTRALAEALGLSVQAVHQWGDKVPLLRQYQIKELQQKSAS